MTNNKSQIYIEEKVNLKRQSNEDTVQHDTDEEGVKRANRNKCFQLIILRCHLSLLHLFLVSSCNDVR